MSEPNYGETRKYWEKVNRQKEKLKAYKAKARTKMLLERAKRAAAKPKDPPDGA